MREQGSGNSAEAAPADTGPQEVQSPADPGPQEFLTVATTRKTLRRSTFLVVGLLVVGLVCLWMMIRKVQPQAAAAQQSQAEQAKIEDAIGRLTGASTEMVDRMDSIVKKFYEFSDVFQVKIGELSKNPFEVEKPAGELNKNVVVTEDPRAQSDMIRYQRLQRQASTLRLVSIMRSDKGPSCMINDQILQEKDRIEDFTVTRIGNNFVDLAASTKGAAGTNGSETEEMKITLKLSQ